MADPVTLVGTALTAGGAVAGALAWQEARRARKDRERLQRQLDNPANSSASVANPPRKYWVKGGTEELYFGKDGSVAAIGKHQNDFSMGFVEGGNSITLRGQTEASSATPL